MNESIKPAEQNIIDETGKIIMSQEDPEFINCDACDKTFKKHHYYFHLHQPQHNKAVRDKKTNEEKKIANDETSAEIKNVLKNYLIMSKKNLDDLIKQLN